MDIGTTTMMLVWTTLTLSLGIPTLAFGYVAVSTVLKRRKQKRDYENRWNTGNHSGD
jgi:hypothetical protein